MKQELIKKPDFKGRPKSYDEKLPERFYTAMVQNRSKSITRVCSDLNISKTSLYRWRKEHPELDDAIELAQTHAEADWEEIGEMGTLGKINGFKPATYELIMKNRFKWTKDGQDAPTGAGNTVFNIQNAAISGLTNEELQRQLTGILKEYKKLEDDCA